MQDYFSFEDGVYVDIVCLWPVRLSLEKEWAQSYKLIRFCWHLWLWALKVVSFETLLFCRVGFHTRNGVSEYALLKFWYHYLWTKEMFAFKYFVKNFLLMCFFVHHFWNGVSRNAVSLATNFLSFQLRGSLGPNPIEYCPFNEMWIVGKKFNSYLFCHRNGGKNCMNVTAMKR